jgi:hypothetical protein
MSRLAVSKPNSYPKCSSQPDEQESTMNKPPIISKGQCALKAHQGQIQQRAPARYTLPAQPSINPRRQRDLEPRSS